MTSFIQCNQVFHYGPYPLLNSQGCHCDLSQQVSEKQLKLYYLESSHALQLLIYGRDLHVQMVVVLVLESHELKVGV
jgi:hypothetical protein